MPDDTPPVRPKKPWAMPGRAARFSAWRTACSKSRWRRGAFGQDRQRLEQRPHFARAHQARHRGVDRIGASVGLARRQLCRALLQARAGRAACPARTDRKPSRRRAAPPRPGPRNRHGRRDRLRPARPARRRTCASPPPAACRRSPCRHGRNRRSAPRRHGPRWSARSLPRWPCPRAKFRRPRPVRRRRARSGTARPAAGTGASAKASTPSVHRHHAFAPAALCLDILADRQRIEELVGQHEERLCR